jgi:Flp pilus assembly protein TadB
MVNVILNILLFLLICTIVYLIVTIISSQNVGAKIKKHIEDSGNKYFENFYKKHKMASLKNKAKESVLMKLDTIISEAGLKESILINPITIISLGVICFLCGFLFVRSIFKIPLLSAVISAPAILLPVLILSLMSEKKKSELESGILDFIIQLRNLTRINNDIVYAFKHVETVEPLKSHIDTFILELNGGIKFEEAIENLKEKVGFEKLRELFDNIKYCYLYGGNCQELMRKSYVMISKVQKEKKNRIQETRSARIVLGILICMDLFVYFTYIKSNYENYMLMTKSILGEIILYWNFISIWFLIALMNKVKTLDY